MEAAASSAQFQKSSGTAISTLLGIALASSAGNPAIFSTMAALNLANDIRYLQVNFPFQVQEFFRQQSSASINGIATFTFGPGMSDGFRELFTKYEIPINFQLWDSYIHSSFLVNSWSLLTTFMILIPIGYLFKFFEKESKEYASKNWYYFFYRARTLLCWNFLVLILCLNMGNIVKFSSI